MARGWDGEEMDKGRRVWFPISIVVYREERYWGRLKKLRTIISANWFHLFYSNDNRSVIISAHLFVHYFLPTCMIKFLYWKLSYSEKNIRTHQRRIRRPYWIILPIFDRNAKPRYIIPLIFGIFKGRNFQGVKYRFLRGYYIGSFVKPCCYFPVGFLPAMDAV